MVNDTAVNVLAGLGTAAWSAPQAVSYEVAQEAIRQAVGYYAHLIAQEESAAEPDSEAIAGWRAEQVAWSARGSELTPLDGREVKRIRAAADKLLSVDEDDDDEDLDEADDADDAADGDGDGDGDGDDGDGDGDGDDGDGDGDDGDGDGDDGDGDDGDGDGDDQDETEGEREAHADGGETA
ncbi:hypothetical protein [Kribbella sp. CA-293567]|uniref:hypothetical protein n=1 Tax=Kribbella sp. CA-293567 TaxID=3002436 RepID=UPI0022DD43ED|nr:hypothetical protein [Kribbella sp. CA-293567]WBQ06479.1 hypothetical protein OX958_06720 [Kribbella sp. CA-293567]